MKVINDPSKYIGLGLTPSPKDARDFKYSDLKSVSQLPPKFKLKTLKVRDQSILGACGAFAYGINAECDGMTIGDSNRLSPLYLYAKYITTKNIGGEGVNMRELLKTAVDFGICREDLYPYPTDTELLGCCKLGAFPPITQEAIQDALKRKLSAYASLNTIEDVKSAIYTENGADIGMLITDSFMKPQNGVIGQACGVIRGYHAIPFIGWNDDEVVTYDYGKLQYGDKVLKTYKGCFYFQNSWAEEWGIKGIGKLPYELFDLNVVEDFYYNLVEEGWTMIHNKTVNYNPTYHIDHQPTTIELKLNSNVAYIDGKETLLDVAPHIVNERTVVPLRFISEALGCNVIWQPETQKIIVEKPN